MTNSRPSVEEEGFAGRTSRHLVEVTDHSATRRERPEPLLRIGQPSLLRFARRPDQGSRRDTQSTNWCPRNPIQRSSRSSSTFRVSFTLPRILRRPSKASAAATDSRPFRMVGVKPKPVAFVARFTRSAGSKTVTFLRVDGIKSLYHISYRIYIRYPVFETARALSQGEGNLPGSN